MKAKGIRRERETIINFNEEDGTASVWTASETIYRRLIKLGYIPSQDNERSATFEMPKRDVRLPRPSRRQKMSEEHKRKLQKGLQSFRKGRFASEPVTGQ